MKILKYMVYPILEALRIVGSGVIDVVIKLCKLAPWGGLVTTIHQLILHIIIYQNWFGK